MAKKAAEITTENIDDLTDEQIAEVTEDIRSGAPAGQQQEEAKPEEKPVEKPVEAKTEDSGDDDLENEPQKADKVDFKRYDYERNRRKEAERAREAEKAEWSRRFDELLKATKGPEKVEEPQPVIPSEDEDPITTIKWLKEQLLAGQQQRQQESEEQKAQREAAEQQQAMLAEAGNEFQQAVTADPQVREAYDALLVSFQAEAQMYRVPPHQMQAHLHDTEMRHIAWARQNRVPLADYIKGLAQSRGWTPKPAQQEQQGNVQQQDTTEAQRRARTLSNSGGSPGVADSLTAQNLLDMDDKDFDAMIAKYGSVARALAAQ